ncbi:MAG: tetratricopeptide repeat protein [Ginsengibacter sp.]
MNNTIRIFLASSKELKSDRTKFKSFIADENKTFQQRGIYLDLEMWENFIDAMSQDGLQSEYNKTIQVCDIFVMLFKTKVGKYTEEEFEKAFKQFKETNKPKVYTYFKNTSAKVGTLAQKDLQSLWAFQEKLKNLKHYQTEYSNSDKLALHFSQQLDKLFAEGYFILPEEKKVTESISGQISKCLAAGQPSIPPEFIGRETELADIKQKLEKNNLLLINAEGGMGKTTLAGKYLENNLNTYKHYAWLFCDTSITEQMKTLAQQLHVDLKEYANEDAQLVAIKTAMENLEKPCLLVLDNANDEKYIEVFRRHFGGLHWHILLTSRCHNVFPGNEYTLDHLKPLEAKAFFKTFHNEEGDEFENLLDKFLLGIGYNTLMIELFSKNLHEISALGETLADMLEILNKKNLFLGEKSFEIKTAYTRNVHRRAATTDQILEVLYDVTKLEETERYLMINLALLPAENHLLTLLIDVLTPKDKIAFLRQLKRLAQKGWLNTDTKSYRMSPVIQQIILSKNKDNLWQDAALLIKNLNQRLKHDGAYLINLKSYLSAKPYSEFARSVTEIIGVENFEVALLLLNLSAYYKGIGNFQSALQHLKCPLRIFEEIDKENYAICLTRLGEIYQEQGDFKKALHFFEQSNDLCKTLFKANSHNESFKKSFAISYERLGDIYEQQGNVKKSLQLFEQYNNLCKELFEANPHSESCKKGLSISYQRLGGICQQKGDLKKALQFFERYNYLCKELFEANPHSESLKNGLAISYEKLGDIYKQQGDLKKALQFFQQRCQLGKELFEANPHSESLKNGLAISHSKLGDVYQQQGNFKKALQLFEQYYNLCKELFEANPISVNLYNGLAISYAKFGDLFMQMEKNEQANEYYRKAEAIWVSLTKSTPEAIQFSDCLNLVKSRLNNL